MRKALIAVAMAFVLVAPAAYAQAPRAGGRGPNIAAMVNREITRLTLLLDLTPGEVSSLTTLFTTYYTNNQSTMTAMRAAQKALHTAETNNDSAGVQAASAQIGTITGQETASRSAFNTGVAGILTSDQLKKYKALGGGFGGRFGGPRGGFGGPPAGGAGGGV